ncbi:MAG: hypothetical protein GY953_24895, partial [bacterium]|nr:hypothetical protein [bacterium]
GAPGWAIAQRRLAARLEAITGWWVDERQHTNGELGGGWGDDVEIIRHWGPQALGFGSEVAARGIRRLADGLWASDELLDGYNREVSDVEHSSEPTTDTLPLAAALDPFDPRRRARLQQTAACAENWIAEQPDGMFRFRGSWFNCHQVDPAPDRAVDVHLNVRAMGPALWSAYLDRDAALIAMIERWGESWRKAMRATHHGKPAGIIPSALRSADGSYLIGSDRWDKPDAEWDYFDWSGRSQEALASLFLALGDLTGKQEWLDAAGESFQVLERCDEHPRLCEEIRAHPETLWEWRRRTGAVPPPASDEQQLARMATLAAEAEQRLAFNFDMFTSEVLYTDRVYYPLAPELLKMLFGGPAPRGERYPTFAVTWGATNFECARAVLRASEDEVRLRLYSFEQSEQPVPVRLWRIQPGLLRWRIEDTTGNLLTAGQTIAANLPVQLGLLIPPAKEVKVVIRSATGRASPGSAQSR